MKATENARIVCTPGTCGGKPRLDGTRIRVQDIYIWYELEGNSVDEILANFPQLSPADVHAAMTYYWDHRDEIQSQMKADDEFVAELRQKTGPGPLEQKLKGADADGSSVSPG